VHVVVGEISEKKKPKERVNVGCDLLERVVEAHQRPQEVSSLRMT
jgi:hypothetical protein